MTPKQKQQQTSRGGRKIGDHWFSPSGFAVLRTPFLPAADFLAWSNGLSSVVAIPEPDDANTSNTETPKEAESKQTTDTSVVDALTQDRAVLRQRLADLYRRPEIRDALFLASPDLEENLDRWLASPTDGAMARIELALVRYFQRMSGRPTPFGLFAGCSLVRIGDETDLRMSGADTYRRQSRLDMDYLSSLMEAAAVDEKIQQQLRFFPNNSIYRTGGNTLRYVESRVDGAGRSHHLVVVDADEYLELALTTATDGARRQQIAQALTDSDPEIETEEAVEYISELIASQLLVPEIGLPVTGPEAMATILDQLAAFPAAESYTTSLRLAHETLAGVDDGGPGSETSRYRNLAESLSELPPEIELKRLIQVDLWKPAPEATLSTRITSEILRGVEIMQGLVFPPQESALDRFKKEFETRYEAREVPLADVLDEESGIGFERSTSPAAEASPLLIGLPFATGETDSRVTWWPVHTLLLQRLQEAIAAGQQEIVLEPDDLKGLGPAVPPPLPAAFEVLTVVHGAPGADPGRNGDVRIQLGGVSGPSGARLLGRFCPLDDELTERVREHLRSEEAHRPDAVFAEIVHLPEGRIGNILFRPILRDYEIPYMGRAAVDEDHQLPLQDLLVSVRSGRVVLRSRRLQREIVPRLTTAHNYRSRAVGLYKFLCQLQNQGLEALPNWSWGPLDKAPFLPRVRCDRLVFSLARWRINRKEIEQLTSDDADAGFVVVQQWRRRRNLPRYIQVVDGDNKMPVDLDNALSVEVVRQRIENRPTASLEEMTPVTDELAAHGPEGAFRHEITVPFVRDLPPQPKPTVKQVATSAMAAENSEVPAQAVKTPETKNVQRVFPPGSEWLYCKLYCGTSTADQVLRGIIGPVGAEAVASGAADRWFFIRYGDPHWSLRVRFHGDPQRLSAEVLPLLQRACRPFLNDGRIWTMQLDTYQREIERYGGLAGIEPSEAFFQADSEAIVRIAGLLSGDAAAQVRWLLAVCGVDLMLDDLGFDLPAKIAAIDPMRTSFWDEFKGNKYMKKELGKKYREHRQRLAQVMRSADTTQLQQTEPAAREEVEDILTPLLTEGRALLVERGDRWRDASQQLQDLEKQGQLGLTLPQLAGSFAHMHCNRILRSSARAHELVIYDFLCREYRSAQARAKKR